MLSYIGIFAFIVFLFLTLHTIVAIMLYINDIKDAEDFGFKRRWNSFWECFFG